MTMKAIIQKACAGLFLTATMLTANSAIAQIDYYENFSGSDVRWLGNDFHTTDIAVCNNESAFRANPVIDEGVIIPVETVSPSLGISNGEEVVLSYDYKLLYFDEVLPFKPVDDPDWGVFILEYGPTRNGPWTLLDAITPKNHIVTDECRTRKIAFQPEEGTEVYLRMIAGGGDTPDISYYLYIDNVSLLQETLTVDPIVTDSDLKAYPNPVEDYLNLDYDGYINDVAIFDMQGQEVVVENVNRDLSRLDMSGLAYGNYILKVTTDNEVRTINIFKY